MLDRETLKYKLLNILAKPFKMTFLPESRISSIGPKTSLVTGEDSLFLFESDPMFGSARRVTVFDSQLGMKDYFEVVPRCLRNSRLVVYTK